MGRNNRIEFNDFDGDNKNKIETEDSAFQDEDIDTDVVDMEEIIQEDIAEERVNIRPKASLFEEPENLDDIGSIIGISDILDLDELDDIDGVEEIGVAGESDLSNVAESESFEEEFADETDLDSFGDIADADDEAKDLKTAEKAVSGPISANFDDDQDDIFDPRNKNLRKKVQKRSIVILSVFLGIVAVVIIGAFIAVLSIANQDTIYSGVSLYGKDLGGMSKREAAAFINEMYIEPIESADVTVVLNGTEYVYPMTDFVECPDAEEKAAEAYSIKRKGGVFERFANILRLKKNGQPIVLVYNFIDTGLNKVMDSAESQSFSDPVDPTYIVKDSLVSLKAGSNGTLIDKQLFQKELLDALAAYENEMSNLGSGESLKSIRIEAVVTTVEFKPLDADEIYNKVYIKPVDAYYYEVSAGVIDVQSPILGRGVDMDLLIEYVSMINNGEAGDLILDIPIESIAAEKTEEEVWDSLFGDELSSCYIYDTSDVTPDGSVDDSYYRAKNLEIIASKLNEYAVIEDKTFNFIEALDWVGEYDGFVYARENINGSGRVLGGGASIAATAVYVSALKYSGFEIEEHTNSEYLPYYGEPGLDAYISTATGRNFTFKNKTNKPIKIIADFDGVGLSITIYGTKTFGNQKVSAYSELISEETDGDTITYTYKVYCDNASYSQEYVVYKERLNGDVPLETPVPSDTPSATPAGTIGADETLKPEATLSPEETLPPEESWQPEETFSPDTTLNPEETIDPDMTLSPEETVLPEETLNPEETANPDETEGTEPTATAQPTGTATDSILPTDENTVPTPSISANPMSTMAPTEP